MAGSECILVIGIGNPLVEDEGVGVRIAEILMQSWDFPPRVTVMDAGTMGMGMLQLFRDFDRLVIIDALDGTGEPPGTVMHMDPEDLATSQVLHSLHDIKLSDVLLNAELMGIKPEVDFIGIQVGSMRELVTDMTPEVEAALPLALETVLKVLRSHDVEATPAKHDTDDARAIRGIRTRERMSPRATPDLDQDPPLN